MIHAVMLLLVSGAAAPLPHAPDARAYSAFAEDPARRFDFWVGRWRVDLRARQPDGEWAPLTVATARIYSILEGKAVLELWDSGPIKGYSLRYYDPERDEWVLWLSWPRQNTSQVSSLSGRFRHGRGVFEAHREQPDGTTLISRYSFSDITPFSLRWDDAYSRDGGNTWRHNWIMEFTREAVEPAWPIAHRDTPTFGDGSACTLAPFRVYEPLAGQWSGTDADGGDWTLAGWRVLGGCSLIGLLEGPKSERFLFLTYNTSREAYELGLLDNRKGTPLRRFFGDDGYTFEADNERWIFAYGDGVGLTIEAGGHTMRVRLEPADS